MNPISNKMRSKIIYFFSAFVLIIVSLCLVIKPVLRVVYPLKFENEIKKFSNLHSLDEHLVMAVISAESKFKEDAKSSKGAKGLMQIKDETASWCVEKFGLENINDENAMNINIGCAYLRYLIDKYKGCYDTALAAYNAGEGNVSSWLNEQGDESVVLCSIPFGETERYVKTVNQRYKIYKFLY